MNGSGPGIVAKAFRALMSRIRSWRRETWALLIWAAILIGLFQLFSSQVATSCSRQPDVAECQDANMDAYWLMLSPFMFAWLIYASAWSLTRIVMLVRRLRH